MTTEVVRVHGLAHGEVVWDVATGRTGLVVHVTTITVTRPPAYVRWHGSPTQALTSTLARHLRSLGVERATPPTPRVP